MDRFRPNLVVEGQTAFDEDHWAHLSIGQIGFEAPKLCDRCVMTTIDPQSGQKSKEPLRALSRFRRFNGAVWFGLNVVPQQTGWLRVGDAVRVLERRSSPFD
jgi:hypothetical protein